MLPESTSITFRQDLSILATEFDARKAAGRFAASRVAPKFGTGIKTGGYPIMNRENFKKRSDTKRQSNGAYNRITGKFGKGTFDCEEHGLEYPIDDAKAAEFAQFFSAEQSAMEILRYQLLLDWEVRASALYSGGGFSNTNVTTAWSTTGSAVPFNDIQTGLEKLEDLNGAGPEDISLVIPRADFRELLLVDQVIDKSKFTNPGIQPAFLNAMQIAAMLGIKEVIIARSSYDSKEEGIAESMTQIWTAGVMYLAVLANENDSLEIPSAARTIIWQADALELPIMESYREEKLRSTIVRSRDHTDEVLQGETDLFVYKLTNT